METPTIPTIPVIMSAEAIATVSSVPLGNLPGVSHRVLWQDGSSMAGVMRVEAGHRLGTHAHRVNHHHIWVIEGEAKILGQTVGPGSYAHVPAGVDHDIDASATAGCTVLYFYLRPAA